MVLLWNAAFNATRTHLLTILANAPHSPTLRNQTLTDVVSRNLHELPRKRKRRNVVEKFRVCNQV